MKDFVKKIFIVIFCIFTLSCNGLLSSLIGENEDVPAEGTIRFNVSVDEKYSRSAAPQAFLNGIYYRLTLSKEGEEVEVKSKFQKTLSFSIPTPSWTGASLAKLEMFCPAESQISTDADGLVTVTSTSCMAGEKTFNLKENTRVFDFNIDLYFSSTDTGTIQLPVTVGTTNIKSCIIVPDDDKDLPVKYIKAPVSDGIISNNYVRSFSDNAIFYFFEEKDDDIELSKEQLKKAKIIYSDSITVFPNTTTDKWIDSDGDEKTVNLENLLYSTFYVDGTNGDDSFGGSNSKPVKKLSTALSKCANTTDGGTIYLKSQPSDTDKIVIDKKVKIINKGSTKFTLPEIEIKEFSSATEVSIKGVKISKSGVTGISVGKNCSLVLDGVEVSGCKNGILAADACTVDLKNSSSVKNCTEYGIMLKDSAGVLKTDGTEVDETKALSSSFDNASLFYKKAKIIRLVSAPSDSSSADDTKADDVLNEAFSSLVSFGDGAQLVLGKTTDSTVTWYLKKGIEIGSSSGTYTVKPAKTGGNIGFARSSYASSTAMFPLVKSTSNGTWNINNVIFEEGTNTLDEEEVEDDGQGGAFYLNSTFATVNFNSCTFQNNKAVYGGAVYAAAGTVEFTDCTIGGEYATYKNTASKSGGAVYLAGASSKLIMNSGSIKYNSADEGGAIYLAPYATAEINGGWISANTATSAGGAVYQSGTFKIGGCAYITPGSDTLSNDVYLVKDKYIEVKDTLTPTSDGTSSGSDVTYTAAITPSAWKRGTQVLSGSPAASNAGKFRGSASEWLTIKDTNDSNKVKLYTSYKIYVAGPGHDTSLGDGKKLANGGLGTKLKPYASIEEAVNQCWTANGDFKIYLSGELKDEAQTIPAKSTSNKTGLAKSIMLEGLTGNTKDIINRGLTGETASESGTALSITTSAVVTIKNLSITGGNTTGHGGGINISGNSKVNLADNVLVYGNKAIGSGGGVIVSSGGTLCLSKNVIIGNKTLSRLENSSIEPSAENKINKAAVGGGIYATGALEIGKTVDSSGTLSNATFTGGIYANISAKTDGGFGMGGGIYASGTLSVNEAAEFEVKNNLAETNGGGMYCSFTDEQNLSAGTFSNNQAANGGGIYNDSGKKLRISGGTFINNAATVSGGALLTYGTFTMTGGTITANTAGDKGAAICDYATSFTIGGTAKITSDSGNNVYVGASSKITISDSTWNNTMSITPNSYDESTVYVNGTALTSKYANIIVADDADSNKWAVVSSGKLKKITVLDSSSISSATLTNSGYYAIGSDINYDQFKNKFNSNNTLSNITIDLRNATFDFGGNSINNKPTNGITTVILSPDKNYNTGGFDWQRIFNNVTNYIVPGESSYFSTEDGVLYNQSKTSIVAYPPSKSDSTFVIPETVTTIRRFAFAQAKNITSMNIPQTCTLETDAFYECSGLRTLTMAGSLRESSATGEFFMNCTNLQTVNFTGSQTCIRSNCFWGCTSLTSITIPATITEVEVRAFKECTSLVTVNFRGTESQRNAMEIASDSNDSFTGANWNYNYTGN